MYRTICMRLWDDPDLKPLSLELKGFFIYLFSNRHSDLTGLYPITLETIQGDLHIGYPAIKRCLQKLEQGEFVFYDAHAELVFVRRMMSYQGRGQKILNHAAAHLATLHGSILIAKFLECYPMVKFEYSHIPRPEGLSTSVANADVPVTNGRDYTAEAETVLYFLNEKTGRKFRSREGNGKVSAGLDFIIARLKSGVDVQTCKTLIMRKVRDWRDDPKMMKYLRPETLFNRTKFESYLAEVSS